MRNQITAEQDFKRHCRLAVAYSETIHNFDLEDEYMERESKHFDFCTSKGKTLPNQDKEYFAQSPYSSIEVCGSGYVLRNHVTGKRFPFATYKAAVMARGGVSQRYQAINRGDTPALSTAGI